MTFLDYSDNGFEYHLSTPALSFLVTNRRDSAFRQIRKSGRYEIATIMSAYAMGDVARLLKFCGHQNVFCSLGSKSEKDEVSSSKAMLPTLLRPTTSFELHVTFTVCNGSSPLFVITNGVEKGF